MKEVFEGKITEALTANDYPREIQLFKVGDFGARTQK